MPEALGRLVAFLREKQILHRLGIVISLSIIAFAFYILFHIVKKIDPDKLLLALAKTDLHSVAWAALAVAAGYFTLTFYDLFALRTIGRNDVPYRIAALAGFTSYAVGHNVGASVFTGGAVRYRVYSAWNLDAIEVAKICFIAGPDILARQCRGARARHPLFTRKRFINCRWGSAARSRC